MIALQQTGPRLCRADGREAALAVFDQHLDNLKACIHYLVAQGVYVLEVDLKRGRHRPVVKVAHSPYLHILFGDDRANVGRKHEGGITRFYWQALKFDITIAWEEVEA